MKRLLIVGVVILSMFGCQSKEDSKKEVEPFNPNNRAKDIVKLLEDDGVKDFQIKSVNKDKIVLENKLCKIEVDIKDEKFVKLKSDALDKSIKEEDVEYSCIYRTLIKDKDFIGKSKEKYEKFMKEFRDKDDFEFENIKVKKSFIHFDLEKR